jgi:hypothetical protein
VTSSTGLIPARTYKPITSRWPAGLAAAVVNQAGDLLVVDEQGVVFREESLPATVTGRDMESAIFSFATSNNGEYIAYLGSRDTLIVRKVATGQVVGSVTVEPRSETSVAAVSDDAARVVLVSSDNDPRSGIHYLRLRQTVTLCDVADGSTFESPCLSDYATKAGAYFYWNATQPLLMYFLPDDRIVVYRQFGTEEKSDTTTTVWYGQPKETSIYDEGQDELTRIEGLTVAADASATGMVVGASLTHEIKRWSTDNASGATQDLVTPLVWAQGGLQPIETPALVFHFGPYFSGAISRGGQSVAIMTGGDLPDTVRGWQVFRPSDGAWRPVGRRCETPVTWIQMNPVAVSDDGSTIWGLRSDAAGSGGGGTRQYPVSVDTATGKWTYWFQAKDLKVQADELDVVALILK